MSNSPLIPIAEGLWEARDEHVMGAGAMHFPLRMSVVARPDGGLVLISAVPIDDALAAALAEAGEVRDILVPNCLHHLHALAALERYPEAQLWLPAGLDKKRPDLSARGRVLTETPAGWGPALAAHLLQGAPAVGEIAVLHRPSRTLITTDLVFHMLEPRGWLMPLVLRLGGAWKRLAQSRLMRSTFKDRQAAKASFEELLSLDFDRLVMAHGEIVERNGHAALAEALAWLAPAPATRAA